MPAEKTFCLSRRSLSSPHATPRPIYCPGPRDRCRARRLSRLELVLLHDALIRFALTLNAILKLALPLRKLRHNLIQTRRCIAQGTGSAKPDHVPDPKAMVDRWVLLHFSHDRTRLHVLHSLSHTPQRQSCSAVLDSR